MDEDNVRQLISTQRKYFLSGNTLNTETRKKNLRKLYKAIKNHINEITDALHADLGKSPEESYMCEIGLVFREIRFMLKHIDRYSAKKFVMPDISSFPSVNYTRKMPYGVTLIMSPWNYPFLLTMEPLVDAIASGNTVFIKPSAYSPATGNLIKKILEDTFDAELVAVITGGRTENQFLLKQNFDHIFFTGSQAVGKVVMKNAAEHLTPVTLELGGKSPAIVDSTAKIRLAAKRIVFGKFVNCGQTCVAPDYVLCHESIKESFLKEVRYQIEKLYGKDPLSSPQYGKIINEKHFNRLETLLNATEIYHGGRQNEEKLQIEPTVLTNVSFKDPVMQEEIFGPILPVLTYKNIDNVISILNQRKRPLALYIFTEDRALANKVVKRCRFGGSCINDTIVHVASSNLPFGGMGESGMGTYHGKAGFDAFSHEKSIVDSISAFDIPLRYPPYSSFMGKLVKMVLH